MDHSCRVCGCNIYRKSISHGTCYRCRDRQKKTRSRCPKCGGGSMPITIKRYGVCRTCHDGRRRNAEDLTGADRERALREFSEWLSTTGSPWQRAISGLRMFVLDDGTGHWP